MKECVSLCIVDQEVYRRLYEIECQKLEILLKGYFVAIEHVGSTSVPDLLAKPIIDIAVGIHDFTNIDSIIFILETNGYIYLANNGEATRKIFVKSVGNQITHHIHIEEFGKQNWINHIVFRNKLLASENLRNEYMDLKKTLSKKYAHDRNKYTIGKADFIQRVLQEHE